MIASTPDAHPDSAPPGPTDSLDQVTAPGRKGVENSPGDPGGAGGGITQDEAFER